MTTREKIITAIMGLLVGVGIALGYMSMVDMAIDQKAVSEAYNG